MGELLEYANEVYEDFLSRQEMDEMLLEILASSDDQVDTPTLRAYNP